MELTANQVAALNLFLERKRRGWSQQETCDRLRDFGVSWRQPTYYGVEASRIPGKPSRRFSVDEVLAFALAFGTPLSTFLTPPPDTTLVLKLGADEGAAHRPLMARELLELGLQRDLPDLRPLAERMREIATAIETFEKARQPEPAAAGIARAAVAPIAEVDESGESEGERELAEWRQSIDKKTDAKKEAVE